MKQEKQEQEHDKCKTKVKTWIGGLFGLSHLYFFGLHTNVKFKAIFRIDIVKILIIHVVIDFNGNHHKKFGWILRRLWTCIRLLKWQHYVYHTKKKKNVDSKNCQSSVKNN